MYFFRQRGNVLDELTCSNYCLYVVFKNWRASDDIFEKVRIYH